MQRWLYAIVAVVMIVAAPENLPAQSESEAAATETAVPLSTSTAPGAVAAPLPYSGTGLYSGTYSVFGAPGYFGVAYGTASYGVPRTYSAFASPYGAGYGYGYAPYAYMPGRFGAGLWQTGAAATSHVPDVGGYRTFPVPYHPDVIPPPLGYYAPGYGPPAYVAW